MAPSKPKKQVDLERIPAVGPFGNYRTWLAWKLSHLDIGEAVKLPLFSAFTVTRWQTGYVVSATFSSQTSEHFAFATGGACVAWVETRDYHPTEEERRLQRMAQIAALEHSGLHKTVIAKRLNIRPALVRHDLTYAVL